ncbi:hypothetical protein ASE19_07625 [Nocardioides sp. Root79]|nr:hypothetical protein ASE19_07625 [Nocardioides sp. Root79]KRC71277.1 hypothetical protein ASE20_10040 [Nocardioides sp. Root240]
MWDPPTCSQDVREAREAELEAAAADDRRRRIDELLHEQFCRDAWIGEDEAGRPKPCPVCHAGVSERLARSRGVLA